ncbi:hypothetical protein [Sphingomonas sp. KR3-1]
MTDDLNKRFDRLLERMANGQAPSAGKKQPEPPKDDDKREADSSR